MKTAGARAAQEFVAGNATMEAAPSPDERAIGARGHPVDVSVTVNVTGSGADPELGVTVSDASVAVASPVTETVADCKILCVVWFFTVAWNVPAVPYV
ncbi:hypothetical protein A3F27_00900 [Candidatus Kaiserbacteria bacterium RIFCSPHIGHO2_12_FULL_53_13]|uniref:Uncharacterized protein n=1 Tax=Candidatus Kaiserbacteria bacterium RIFCSPHIGHO2_12_FULL_53_13 TaxID=1798502 RepID=A0A1F6E7Y8_9BACT|nr:MAG: hypothetical protein A3F27_00900 [Candidatus Kaiserbacteria bacterium RIFCSPHIGHO2_12_FULL_53_13]